jgi:hypothetical protein
MNEIMKVLTLIGSIFIPLTFLAGVYGMNFHYLPELGLKWAYPAAWLVCVILIVIMLSFFAATGCERIRVVSGAGFHIEIRCRAEVDSSVVLNSYILEVANVEVLC